MTNAHTAGELKEGTFRAEALPGTIQTGVLTYIGDSISLSPNSDHKAGYITLPGNRTFGAVQRGPYELGCTYKYYSRAAGAWGDWRDFIAKYALGAVDNPTDHLSTFTFICYVISSGKWEVYPGCKINKAVISGDNPGNFLQFEAQIFSMAALIEPSKTITDYQGITIGADPTFPTEALLYWDANQQMNLNGGGLLNHYPKKWSLTIDNHLDRLPAVQTWYDGTKYPAAIELHEDIREIIYECEMLLKDATWDIAKHNHYPVTALTLPIGNKVITLSDGDLVPNNFRDLSQKLGSDNLKIMFPTLSIA